MGWPRMARKNPVEMPVCPHDQCPHHAPRRGDGGRHGPPHSRSAQEEEDQEGTTVAKRKDVA